MFAICSSGSAAIEFALVLPVMVLLPLGLADTARYNLAQIDVDAAVHTAAVLALKQTVAPQEITTTVTSINPAAFPPGRYLRITAVKHVPSLFGPIRPPEITATAIVRLS